MTIKTSFSVHIVLQGEIISSSKNLRGVLTYARKHGVTSLGFCMTSDYGADIAFSFGNGARCQVHFQSFNVCQRWVRARKSWGLKLADGKATNEWWVAV